METRSDEVSISDTKDMTHIEFQSHMPYIGLNLGELTVQQEKARVDDIEWYDSRCSRSRCRVQVVATAYAASKLPQVQQALQYFRDQMREEVKFTKTNAHSMYMEAYSASATATEMKNTVDSLVKLHGLGLPDQATQININLNATAKQLERLSDEELLEIAGKSNAYLEPAAS